MVHWKCQISFSVTPAKTFQNPWYRSMQHRFCPMHVLCKPYEFSVINNRRMRLDYYMRTQYNLRLLMYRGFSMRQSFWWKQKMHIPVNMWITSSVDQTSLKTHDSSRPVWFFALSRLILLLLSSKLNPYHSLISIPDVNKTLWQRPMRMHPITSHFHSYLCSVSPYCHIKFDSPVIRILKRTHISAWYHPTNLLTVPVHMNV